MNIKNTLLKWPKAEMWRYDFYMWQIILVYCFKNNRKLKISFSSQVLEGKGQFVEFAGNLVPVTKSGDQLQLGFRGFRENRLAFTTRVKDPHADPVGRILFMKEAKVWNANVMRFHRA